MASREPATHYVLKYRAWLIDLLNTLCDSRPDMASLVNFNILYHLVKQQAFTLNVNQQDDRQHLFDNVLIRGELARDRDPSAHYPFLSQDAVESMQAEKLTIPESVAPKVTDDVFLDILSKLPILSLETVADTSVTNMCIRMSSGGILPQLPRPGYNLMQRESHLQGVHLQP
jgi:hypothetical protein